MTKPAGGTTQQTPSQAPVVARGITLAITNIIKLAGLIVFLNEILLKDGRPIVLAVCVFMMSGAQTSETLVMGVIDRVIGRNGNGNGNGTK